MRSAVIWLLLLCGGAFGQGLVDAPSISKRDQPIKINHPEGAKIQAIYADVVGGEVQWSFLPEDHFIRSETQTIFAAPPGDYLVTAGDSTILKVVEEGNPRPKPDPKPDPPDPRPDPEPDPDPEPSPDQLRVNWAIWVEEISERINHPEATDTMLAATNDGSDVNESLTDRGIKVRAYDDDQQEAGPFLSITANRRPSLVLMETADRFLVFDAPKSPEELETLIRRHAIR